MSKHKKNKTGELVQETLPSYPSDSDIKVIRPPEFAFEKKNRNDYVEKIVATGKGHPMPITVHIEYTERGVFRHFQGIPFRRKGFPYPDAANACNFAKRRIREFINMFASKDLFLSYVGFLFTFRKSKIRIIEHFLKSFTAQANFFLDDIYPTQNVYCKFTNATWVFLNNFLVALGISPETAFGFAKVFATLLEYDDGYWLRAADGFSTTTAEELYKRPAREFRRVMNTIYWRDATAMNGGEETGLKFKKIGQMMFLLLLFPSVKKAFRTALNKIVFFDFQLDHEDRYWGLNVGDYNFLGLSFEERMREWGFIHKDGAPPSIQV